MDGAEIHRLPRHRKLDIRQLGDIDISAYAGKKVQIAFIYGAGCTDKWEINDLKFAK